MNVLCIRHGGQKVGKEIYGRVHVLYYTRYRFVSFLVTSFFPQNFLGRVLPFVSTLPLPPPYPCDHLWSDSLGNLGQLYNATQHMKHLKIKSFKKSREEDFVEI
jgi:hypothetical protein